VKHLDIFLASRISGMMSGLSVEMGETVYKSVTKKKPTVRVRRKQLRQVPPAKSTATWTPVPCRDVKAEFAKLYDEN
jgi:hypothetical protein